MGKSKSTGGVSIHEALNVGKLSQFDGRDVIRSAIALTNAGDGLSEAMAVDPQEFHLGDRVVVLVEAECSKIQHAPIKDTQALARVHTFRASAATIVAGDTVDELLEAHREKLEEHRLATTGQARFDEAEALQAEHDDGQHKDDLRDGCPSCEEEKALTDAGE